ncbi:MAG: hypothetical protein HYY03_09750, partial [Chloroflexi bacterium]|nr:hypothetical protein [Chloroflexota bacterium]
MVDSFGDTNARDGVVTLREAILLATGGLALGSLDPGEANNVTGTPGPASADTIVPSIPGGGLALLTAPLPPLSTGNDTLDGGGPGTIIDGQTYSFTCFEVTSNGNVLKGATVRRCSTGILIDSGAQNNTLGGTTPAGRGVIIDNTVGVRIAGAGTNNNRVTGSYIGVASDGVTAASNGIGVRIDGGAQSNTIGGSAAGERNVISGNSGDGIAINGAGTSGNTVSGNFIGTKASGTEALGNGVFGVEIVAAPDNTIGGTAGITVGGPCTGACNVISGNDNNGVNIRDNSALEPGNVVQGNYIGVDVTGAVALGNVTGVALDSSPNNTIGGTTVAARNIISGGRCVIGCGSGVVIADSQSTGNLVQGNYIGTDVTGMVDLGNFYHGVVIFDEPSGNVIGGTTATPGTPPGNIISGNDMHGIFIYNDYLSTGRTTTGNSIKGNLIGTDVTGASPLPNTGHGVIFSASTATTSSVTGNPIGGAAAGDGNVIAFNGQDGVCMHADGATGNSIRGNSIHSNGLLGIDLAPPGPADCATGTVTLNDPNDLDSGPNNLMNFPVITSVLYNGMVRISGTLDAVPPAVLPPEVTIDLYATDVADGSGYGEGRVYLGSTTAPVLPPGAWSITIASVPLPVLTATATDLLGNTSEFSAAFVDPDHDGVPDPTDNCPNDFNPFQMDMDADGTGEVCQTSARSHYTVAETESLVTEFTTAPGQPIPGDNRAFHPWDY